MEEDDIDPHLENELAHHGIPLHKDREVLQTYSERMVITWGVDNPKRMFHDHQGPMVLISQCSTELPTQEEWIQKNNDYATHRVAVSRGAADAFGDFKNQKTLNIALIPNMVDPEHIRIYHRGDRVREELGVTNEEVLVLWLGRFAEQKRPYFAIDVLYNLPHEFKLLMAGPRNTISEAIQASRPSSDCRLGIVHGLHAVGDVLNASDIVLLTSTAEGLPTTVLESLCAGKPVVMPNLFCAEELNWSSGRIHAYSKVSPAVQVASTLVNAFVRTQSQDENELRDLQSTAQKKWMAQFVCSHWDIYISQIYEGRA